MSLEPKYFSYKTQYQELSADLKAHLHSGDIVFVMAQGFSIFAYQKLKEQLDSVKSFHFLFPAPTFTDQLEQALGLSIPVMDIEGDDEQALPREFYIPRLKRELSLYGSEYEIKLNPQLLELKRVAKECAAWIQSNDQIEFRSVITPSDDYEDRGILIQSSTGEIAASTLYTPICRFTLEDLGFTAPRKHGFSLVSRIVDPKAHDAFASSFLDLFYSPQQSTDVTDTILAKLNQAYDEHSPEQIYLLTLYHVLTPFLNDNLDGLNNDRVGLKDTVIWSKLYDFQRDAAWGIIAKLEKYDCCILADSVGLGKTYTTLAVIKYYELHNYHVLVLCPKKLGDNWATFNHTYKDNELADDRFNYELLYHTDLTRSQGESNGKDLKRFNWAAYDLIVIDESHNFRNGSNADPNSNSRYQQLINKALKKHSHTKVLMLSATPVNNRFNDLKNQLLLAYAGSTETMDKVLYGQGYQSLYERTQSPQDLLNPANSRSTAGPTMQGSTCGTPTNTTQKISALERLRALSTKPRSITAPAPVSSALPVMQHSSTTADSSSTPAKSVDRIFKQAQKAFNDWSKQPADQRTTADLVQKLDLDIFELLDMLTIARSRHHIQQSYDMQALGAFPERNKPLSFSPDLTDLKDCLSYKEIAEALSQLKLCLYSPSIYVLPSRRGKYPELFDSSSNITHQGREAGIQRLMHTNLLKRLESSVSAFVLTVKRMLDAVTQEQQLASAFMSHKSKAPRGSVVFSELDSEEMGFDDEDEAASEFLQRKGVKIDLNDMDYRSWLQDLTHDQKVLQSLLEAISKITPAHDLKLQQLKAVLSNKVQHPINEDNRKVIVFTAFADTALYLYHELAPFMLHSFGINTVLITGSGANKCSVTEYQSRPQNTLTGTRLNSKLSQGSTMEQLLYGDYDNTNVSLNQLLSSFSPRSKSKDKLFPEDHNEIDLLIATDCISEGQNLQDCDFLVNFDIHWNPVRILQRFGRIDRLNSSNSQIQLVNFWPNINLDEYIKLKERVANRMNATVLTSTGDSADDPINTNDSDLSYRKAQLERLQKEVVDLEDMGNGVSIQDLGFADLRADLKQFMHTHTERELARYPLGLHALVPSTEQFPAGLILVLKKLEDGSASSHQSNSNKQRRRILSNKHHDSPVAPFYLLYVDMQGQIKCSHIQAKQILDTMRLLCLGRKVPDLELCAAFNRETSEGQDMTALSQLLSKAIKSMSQKQGEAELMNMMLTGAVLPTHQEFADKDFELICMLIIRDGSKTSNAKSATRASATMASR